MPVAILQARHALAVVRWISNVQRLALVALRSHGVVVTLDALVEFVWSSAVTVAIALALDRAVRSDVSKVTTADVWLDAGTADAALGTHRHADLSSKLVK